MALSSDATVTQVSTTPLKMPPSISGTTMRRKVCSGERPRLIEASSSEASIWWTMALAERTANGTLRTRVGQHQDQRPAGQHQQPAVEATRRSRWRARCRRRRSGRVATTSSTVATPERKRVTT